MAINILKSCKSVIAYVKNRSFPSHIRPSFPWRPPLAEILDPRLTPHEINNADPMRFSCRKNGVGLLDLLSRFTRHDATADVARVTTIQLTQTDTMQIYVVLSQAAGPFGISSSWHAPFQALFFIHF